MADKKKPVKKAEPKPKKEELPDPPSVIEVGSVSELDEAAKLKKALDLLNDLYEQTQEDCPTENRSRHLHTTLTEAEVFLVDTGMRKWN